MTKNKLLMSGLVCLALVAWAGPASAQIEIGVDYYSPEFYLDFPVFFDEAGRPIYHADGEVHYVPRSYPRYRRLVRHYRTHSPAYHRWYRRHGHRHHGYRRVVGYTPLYHDGYVVYYDDGGLPYYYVDNRRVFIPRHHPRFRTYSGHYRTHRVHYRTWHQRHGRTYRTYRHPGPGRVGVRAGGPRGGVGVRVGAPPPRHVGPRHAPPRRHVGPRHAPPPRHVGPRHAPPPPRHAAPPARGRRGGGVDCAANPGHPACKGGAGSRRQPAAGQGGRERRREAAPDRGSRGGGSERRGRRQ